MKEQRTSNPRKAGSPYTYFSSETKVPESVPDHAVYFVSGTMSFESHPNKQQRRARYRSALTRRESARRCEDTLSRVTLATKYMCRVSWVMFDAINVTSTLKITAPSRRHLASAVCQKGKCKFRMFW